MFERWFLFEARRLDLGDAFGSRAWGVDQYQVGVIVRFIVDRRPDARLGVELARRQRTDPRAAVHMREAGAPVGRHG
jgi:hypothetical protein